MFHYRARFTHNTHGQPIYSSDTAAALGRPKRARAAIVVLAQDSDCDGVLRSMARMEARFNAKFGYPYVFLNNEPFGADFINRWACCAVCLSCAGYSLPVAVWSEH